MSITYADLAVVAGLALAAPLVAQLRPQLRLPSPVIEIVLGILVGPSLLGWVVIDQPVRVLSDLGLAALLFLAGLEIDVRALLPHLRRVVVGYAASVVLSILLAVVIGALADLDSVAFVGFALASSTVGLIAPVLRDAGAGHGRFGQAVLAGTSIGEFGAILLLSLFFSDNSSSTGSRLLLLCVFGAFVAIMAVGLWRLSGLERVERTLHRLERTSAQLGVRFAVAIVIGFAALATSLGLETILATFVAGLLLRLVDDQERLIHPEFRLKIEAVGYGFLVPVFFISSGVELDFKGLFQRPGHLVVVPAFLIAMLISRGLPALAERHRLGVRPAMALGLLQAVSLPVMVIAAKLGHELHIFDDPTDAALVLAGVLSVMLFPPIALRVMEGEAGRSRS